MPITLTYHELKALEPCKESFDRVTTLLGDESTWNGNAIDADTARKAGCTFDDIVWATLAIARNNPDVERRLRLWMADCAAHVLNIYEKSGPSDAPRKAIIAARQFARGEIGDDAISAARIASWDAARGAARGAGAARAAWAATRNVKWAYADDAYAAACAAVWAAGCRTAKASALLAMLAEEEWLFDRLISRLSDNEPEDWPLHEINTGKRAA